MKQDKPNNAMENRTKETPPNEERAKDIAMTLTDKYWLKEDAITHFDPDSKGQIQLVLGEMMRQLTPEDAIRAGLRMELKETGAVNDLTILGECVAGQIIYEGSDFGDARDFEFIREVLKGVIVELKARMIYASGADDYVRGRDYIKKD